MPFHDRTTKGTDATSDRAIKEYVDDLSRRFDPTAEGSTLALPFPDLLQREMEGFWKGKVLGGRGLFAKSKSQFTDLMRVLYRRAAARGEAFVTVQVGAHNGRENDPLHGSLVRAFDADARAVRKDMPDTWAAGVSPKHWRHIAVEPVAQNFKALTKNYRDFAGRHGLAMGARGMQLVRAAVALPSQIDVGDAAGTGGRTNNTCHFFSINVWDDRCHNLTYMEQIGKLDRKGLLKHTDLDMNTQTQLVPGCLQDQPVPCFTTPELVRAYAPGGFDALVVDTEGFDFNVVRMLLDGTTVDDPSGTVDAATALWPALIYFEIKILNPWGGWLLAREFLTRKGYVQMSAFSDALFVRVPFAHHLKYAEASIVEECLR